MYLSPASVILSCRKHVRLNSSRASGDSVGLASLLQGLPGSAWHSSTGKWKLALLYSWLSTCRLEQQTSTRELWGIRNNNGAASGSFDSSRGREAGAGVRLRSSLVNVSLINSTEPEGLVMSSHRAKLASLRKIVKDNLGDLKDKLLELNKWKLKVWFLSCKS